MIYLILLNTTIFFPFPHFFTLVVSYFYMMKDRVTLFPPETIVAKFVHLMMFICNLFIHLYSDRPQDSPFHFRILALKTLTFCASLINQQIHQSIWLNICFVVLEIAMYIRDKGVRSYTFFFSGAPCLFFTNYRRLKFSTSKCLSWRDFVQWYATRPIFPLEIF